jgi:hypothetical protein
MSQLQCQLQQHWQQASNIHILISVVVERAHPAPCAFLPFLGLTAERPLRQGA